MIHWKQRPKIELQSLKNSLKNFIQVWYTCSFKYKVQWIFTNWTQLYNQHHLKNRLCQHCRSFLCAPSYKLSKSNHRLVLYNFVYYVKYCDWLLSFNMLLGIIYIVWVVVDHSCCFYISWFECITISLYYWWISE